MKKKNEDQLLDRRDALRLIGAAGVTALLGSGGGTISSGPGSIVEAGLLPLGSKRPKHAPDCVVQPALTEGPYFVDEKLNRYDIRSDPSTGVVKEGVLLKLNLSVVQV